MNTDTITDTLCGQSLPRVALSATNGATVDLSAMDGVSVVYAYPRTSPPNEPPIEGWDQIPGARGCTPQSQGFAEHHDAIIAAGAARVFGLSTQDTAYQQELVNRLSLPFDILSDEQLTLAKALGLPTFQAGGMVLLTRITLIIDSGTIKKVFYPVSDPGQNALDIAAYLRG